MDETDKLRLLAQDVISKSELSNLEPTFVMEKIILFLKNHPKASKKLESSEYSKFRRSKEHEHVLKIIRADLRKIYGVFILQDYKKRESLLLELKSDQSLEAHNRILELHRSSKERLPIYSQVYKKIFEHTGMPKKIIDLACGLNPISYPYILELGCKPEYLACDLSENDLGFIQKYFNQMQIKGCTERIDLVKDDLSGLSKGADIAFLFKTLDSLEAVEWNSSERLLKQLNSRFIVVSFATKSIGGKKEIRKEKRGWFERLVKRNGWEYSDFELPGEFFYVVRKD
jgi:16S rRNA (guanine(1405)-N(7))-methyltransferase